MTMMELRLLGRLGMKSVLVNKLKKNLCTCVCNVTECAFIVCTHCKKPLKKGVKVKNGKPYCAADYEALFSKKCSRCGNTISGPSVE